MTSSWQTGIPTIADFLTFLSGTVGIPASALPASSPFPQYALDNAVAIVNPALSNACAGGWPAGYVSGSNLGSLIYIEAVYNLATSNLLNYCPDVVPSVVYPPGDAAGLGFFAYTRNKWDMTSFIGGVINSTSDEGTSESMTVPDYFQLFTVADLQTLKDPYGRRYMGLAQKYGSNLWGLS